RMAREVAKVEPPKAPPSLSPDATIPAAVHAARLACVTPAPKDTLASFLAPLPSSMYMSSVARVDDPQAGVLVCTAQAHAWPSSRPITDGAPATFSPSVVRVPSADTRDDGNRSV